jgi:hypothetical protein
MDIYPRTYANRLVSCFLRTSSLTLHAIQAVFRHNYTGDLQKERYIASFWGNDKLAHRFCDGDSCHVYDPTSSLAIKHKMETQISFWSWCTVSILFINMNAVF